MKKMPAFFAAIAFAAFFIASCKKDTTIQSSDVSQEVINQIKALGFDTQGVQKIPEGYLVENDIILTESNLQGMNASNEMVIANEEHYRTTNLITGLPRNITVSCNTTAAPFPAAVTEALRRYNAENLSITFSQVSGNADINIVTFYQVSNTLGSSGFPSGGNPYSTVNMNTYWYTASTDVNYLATIIAHEIGHCIGMRHTDYMSRQYSCGGRKYNEGTAGVGAVYIPGTPTGPEAGSWMLACVATGVNRPFTANDKVALNYIY